MYIPNARHIQNSTFYNLACLTFLVKQQAEILYNSLTILPPSPILPAINLDDSQELLFQYIYKYIHNPSHINQLVHIASQIVLISEFQIYTDGSFTSTNNHVGKMGFAFKIISDEFPFSFNTSILSSHPSSFHSELCAFFASLLVIPRLANVCIYTDCQSLIDKFLFLSNSDVLQYYASTSKIPYYQLWSYIFDVISSHNIHVTFTKVTAHSNDLHNNDVDRLAKEGLSLPSLSFNDTSTSTFTYLPLFNKYSINVPLRSFITQISNCKGFFAFYNLDRNLKYRKLSMDWLCTFQYINNNSIRSITFNALSRVKGRRIKCLLEELPTLNRLYLINPHVYKDF